MTLKLECTTKAYRENVASLIRSGKRPREATAIAIRTLKKAGGIQCERKMSPAQIVQESARLVGIRELKTLASQLKSYGKESDGFDDFDSVLDAFEDQRVELRPTSADYEIMRDLKSQREPEKSGTRTMLAARDYWKNIALQCPNVAECLRIYGLALEMEMPGLGDSFQKRAIELANKEKWI